MKILSEILLYEDQVVEFALGNIGKSLKKFASISDHENSEIYNYISDDLSEKLSQILKFVNYGCKNGFDKSIICLSKYYNKFLSDDLKSLDKKIRFIKDLNLRNELRKSKKVSNISLLSFYEKAHAIWHSLPDDFEFYSKDNLDYKNYLDESKVKANRFKDLGCKNISKSIFEEVEQTSNNMSDTLFGYHKISIKNASIILSKINGYKLQKNNFNYEIINNKNLYFPKICPIYMLDNYLKIIENLDKQSLFDHYFIIIPSYKKDDITLSLEEDLQLIKNHSIIPILLGDKDGICYFISYL